MSEVVRVCGRHDIEPGTARKFEIGTRCLAVVRIDDDVYAIDDRCSHEDYSLSEGEVLVEECEIECWKHGSMFSLVTGQPVTFPATVAVPVYAVVVEGDDVSVVAP